MNFSCFLHQFFCRLMPILRRPLGILLLFFLFSACQSLHAPHPKATTTPALITDWQASGKLGFKTPQDQGSVYFSWISSPRHYQITLNNSFGLFLAKIEGSPEVATLLTREGLRRTGTPESLLSETLGIYFPIPVLNFWLRGLPSPNMPAQWIAPDHFEQAHWQIYYLQWRDDIHLPTQLKLKDVEHQTQSTIILNWKNFS